MCAVVTTLPCVQTACITARVRNFLHKWFMFSLLMSVYLRVWEISYTLPMCAVVTTLPCVYKRPVYLRVWEISCTNGSCSVCWCLCTVLVREFSCTLPMCAVVTTLPCVQTACVYLRVWEISCTNGSCSVCYGGRESRFCHLPFTIARSR